MRLYFTGIDHTKMIFDQISISRGLGTLVLLTVFFAACTSDKGTNIPDVSDIKIDLDITRFEQLLLADTMIDAAGVQKLMDDYPAFADVYFKHVMPGAEDILASDDPEARMQQISAWIRHPRTRWLYDTVQTIFPEIEKVKTDLTSALTYAKYYFPEKATPRVFTTVSDFGYFPFVYAEDSLRDGIGISLEMFLGDTFPYMNYTGLNNAFSNYLTRSYNKDHLVKRALEVWVDDLAGAPSGNRLLDLMIHNGKKLYVLQALMPMTSDTIIMDYASVKMDWVKASEKNIWYHFTAQDMLYETSLSKIQKHIGPSPTSPGMPPESPGNTASWLGWQIVTSYMKSHPETTLPQLLAMNDAQVILDESGYRPPR
jgi:hypothetical protein